MINIYSSFRLILLAFTLYNAIQLAINLIRYKPYYDKIPTFLKKHLITQGGKLLSTKLKDHQEDFTINSILLGILILLNFLDFLL